MWPAALQKVSLTSCEGDGEDDGNDDDAGAHA
jgi:hypothetical protein